MNEIKGQARTVRELLQNRKYGVDYYQREYRWGQKQVQELIQDLTAAFLDNYEVGHDRPQVEEYGHYFLGSIILSQKDNLAYIVDGQQRLTTLTLLLIFLHGLQKGREDAVSVKDLIYSEKYGRKSFNLQVEEREAGMRALFDEEQLDSSEQPESVQNILARYEDIKAFFPEELTGAALPYSVDWLLDNVHLVEITAYSDEEAYTIFETMNDRGLSLTPVEMLKGYLLSNITGVAAKEKVNRRWKQRVQELTDIGKDVDSDFFKNWLRSQYANAIRERKRNATAEDYDVIGTAFHRWVRDNRGDIGLNGSESFSAFVERDFDFYSRYYLRLMRASEQLQPGWEHVYYNAQHGFTLQYQSLLAPLRPDDPEPIARLKVRLVAMYLDIMLNRRLWNWRSIAYSTMQYAMFLLMRDVRGKEPEALARLLRKRLEDDRENFDANDRFSVHQQNRYYVQRMLARMTDFVEQGAASPSRYVEYTTGSGKQKYEVEHIWANQPERHVDEFPHPTDFQEYRNRIGGLLLLPKSFNASFGALPYEQKLEHYNGQNLLARSLHPLCYDHNPGFLRFIGETGLPFRPHLHFRRADLDERQELYRQIAKQVWDPAHLTHAVEL